MLSIRKILFPVDFSARCTGAARHVAAMAKRFSAEVTLLHVVGRREDVFFAPEFGGTSLMEQYEHHLLDAKKFIKEYLSQELEGIPVVREVLTGDAALEVTRFADRHQSDLIMMPSHGYGVFRRFILGSVTSKVLHDAAIPVWTDTHSEVLASSGDSAYRNVFCAVDLGPQSELVLRWAKGMSEANQASLTVVHAVAWEPLAGSATTQVEALMDRLGMKARVVVGEGEAAKLVSQLATENKADLLVIARGSASPRTDAGRLGRLRSNAHALIHSSPCPVLSV